MAALVWDKTGERYWENGVDHGVLYVEADSGYKAFDPESEKGVFAMAFMPAYLDPDFEGEAEEPQYTLVTDQKLKFGDALYKGVVWNGLTGVTESPDGAEPTDLWADNIKYASLRSAETFGATIEAYTYPAEFAECDGSVEPVPGLRLGQQKRKPFGFAFRTNVGNDTASESDDGYKIHIIYNATASPSERAYETVNDSPDAITFSWEITTTPINVSGYKPVSTITLDSTKFTSAAQKKTLKAIEAILFGEDGVNATLIPPEQLILMMYGAEYGTEDEATGDIPIIAGG